MVREEPGFGQSMHQKQPRFLLAGAHRDASVQPIGTWSAHRLVVYRLPQRMCQITITAHA
jgi:hypothetical protein